MVDRVSNVPDLKLQESDLLLQLLDVSLVLLVLLDLLLLVAVGLIQLLVLVLYYRTGTLKKFFSSSSW